MLAIKNITKKFGGIAAVNNLSVNLERGSITGLIGPNGSGKTTVFNLIMNLLKPDSGEIYFENKRIDTLTPHEITRLGIGRTFQDARVFRKITVFQNMIVSGMYKKMRTHKRAIDLLNFVGLIELKDEYAENLSYGQQKLLEFASALMPDPGVLLLDEPVSGINPRVIELLKKYIQELNDKGKTFFIIEHNIPFVVNICSRVIVLNYGEKIAEGSAQAIQDDKRVIDAYLGEV